MKCNLIPPSWCKWCWGDVDAPLAAVTGWLGLMPQLCPWIFWTSQAGTVSGRPFSRLLETSFRDVRARPGLTWITPVLSCLWACSSLSGREGNQWPSLRSWTLRIRVSLSMPLYVVLYLSLNGMAVFVDVDLCLMGRSKDPTTVDIRPAEGVKSGDVADVES